MDRADERDERHERTEPGHPHTHTQHDLTRQDRDRELQGPEGGNVRDDEDLVDKEGMDSFPASDPPGSRRRGDGAAGEIQPS